MKRKIIGLIFGMIMLIAFIPSADVQAEIFKYSESGSGTTAETKLTPKLVIEEADSEKKDGAYEIKFGEADKVITVPVELSDRGGLYITLGEQDTNYYSLTATLYKDEACKDKVGYSAYLFSGDGIGEKTINVDKSGLYYLKLELSKKSTTGQISFLMQLTMFSGENQELSQGKVIFSYQDYDQANIYYKVSAKADGLLSFAFGASEDGFRGKVQLLNKDKKALSAESYIIPKRNDAGEYDDVVYYYTVKKGTYYIKVDTSVKLYGVQYDFKEVKDGSGASKEKSKTLKLGGSAAKGVLFVTDKTSNVDWYKFTLTSEKKVKITINSYVDGKIKFEIMDSKGRTLWFGTKTIYEGKNETVLESDGKWSKGTFYIKMSKYDGTSSGYYTIKVK